MRNIGFIQRDPPRPGGSLLSVISPRNFNFLVEVNSEGTLVRTLGEGMLIDAHDPEFLNTGNILVSNQVKPHEALEFDPDTNESVWRRSRSTGQRHQHADGQQDMHDEC